MRRQFALFSLLLTAALLVTGGCCACRPYCGDSCGSAGGMPGGCPPCAEGGARPLRTRTHAWLAALKSHAPGAHPSANPAPTPMFHPLPTRPVFAGCAPETLAVPVGVPAVDR